MLQAELRNVFGAKYQTPSSDWGGHSGGGSDARHNLPYRSFVESFIALNQIKSIDDVGCGDWQFSKYINFGDATYAGLDIVPSIIERNRFLYGSASRTFGMMPEDLTDLPGADLLIIKDVLQHLPDKMILQYKSKLFTKYRFCLITNSYRKVDTHQNVDVKIGDFRCLDLTTNPYNFNGVYVLEYFSPLWETIRVLLLQS